MINYFIGLCPFFIIYTKVPNPISNIATNHKRVDKLVIDWINNINSFHSKVTQALQSSDQKYKAQANVHWKVKTFYKTYEPWKMQNNINKQYTVVNCNDQ